MVHFVVVLVVAVGAVLWTAPRTVVPLLAKRNSGCVYSVTTNKPYVALTIDDGPDTTTTTALLETLRAHQARATFFLISEHVTSDSLVRALVAGGHEIGNHMTRDESSIKLSSVAFDSALATAGRRLSAFGPVRWARPGGGRHNRTMIATMHKQGYECALGSIYPYDAQFASSTFSASFILAHVRPGAIIVLHDGGKRGERTRATLERVLPQLRRRGLHVVTLSELVDARAASPHTK